MTLRDCLLGRLKKTAVVWAAVYPSVLAVLSLVGDLLQDWPLPLRVLGTTVLIVPVVTNITEPLVRAALASIARAKETPPPPQK